MAEVQEFQKTKLTYHCKKKPKFKAWVFLFRIKIKYINQIPGHYPQFVCFANLPQYIKDPYKRFIENKMRSLYGFTSVPIKIYFRKK